MTDEAIGRSTVARRHTAELLKMLRGYGPAKPPAPVDAPASVTSQPACTGPTVTEAPAVYRDPAVTPPATPTITETPAAYCERVAPPAHPSSSGMIPAKAATTAPLPPARPVNFDSQASSVGESLFRHKKGILGELMARAERLARLNRIFRAYLPPHLRDHATLICLDGEQWVVQTESSEWATRLRYALPNIRDALGQHLAMVLPKPQIRIVPAEVPSRPPRPPMSISERSAKVLENAASNQSDPKLSAALRKLAAHAPSRSPR